MLITKSQRPILILNSVLLIIFTIIFSSRRNYEFLGYIAVIVGILFLILYTNNKMNYPDSVLWGLTVWAAMHLFGGGVYISGKKLYEFMIINLVGAPYHIFKYDQLTHIVGFFVATLLMYHLIKNILRPEHRWTALSIVIIMAGLGVGALNEIIEFTATVLVPDTGVGGYENTALDLVADLIGAVFAMIYIQFKEKKT